MTFDLTFPRASQSAPATGKIKTQVDDFYVEELMDPELSGEGEHVWLWVEKSGQNTEYVAGQIAQFANVKKMDVGLSGLKDRWAKTQQWFSVYLGAKTEPDWATFDLEHVSILKHIRHSKKLRRGEHDANRFRIVVRELDHVDNLESDLNIIKEQGFPNYYGLQRFGFQGANLERGERYFEGEIKASRSQRSFYLSAARSFLFNLNLAEAIKSGVWLSAPIGGPLYGDQQDGVIPISEAEKQLLDNYPSLAKGIHKNRLKLDRRAFSVMPSNLSWEITGDTLMLEFDLPSGIFATSLLSELMEFSVVLGES